MSKLDVAAIRAKYAQPTPGDFVVVTHDEFFGLCDQVEAFQAVAAAWEHRAEFAAENYRRRNQEAHELQAEVERLRKGLAR